MQAPVLKSEKSPLFHQAYLGQELSIWPVCFIALRISYKNGTELRPLNQTPTQHCDQ